MARTIHKVEQGEHLSAIAAQYGFKSFIPIWNADENAHLRAVRNDPHQLLPGDEVVIPEKRPMQPFKRQTGASYTFKVYREKLNVRLKVVDLAGKPMAGVSAKLTAGDDAKDLKTNSDGVLESPVPGKCTSGTLSIGDASYDLGIGALDPTSEPSGQAGRLMNLGYWYGDDDDLDDPDALRLAIQLFQSKNGLDVTGVADSDFIRKLDAVYDGRG
jgi:hypothetical protein